jgi:hypothetical protein
LFARSLAVDEAREQRGIREDNGGRGGLTDAVRDIDAVEVERERQTRQGLRLE